MEKILVTGCAGFIGYHLCKKILSDNEITVIGIDNINDYYDVNLKKNRLTQIETADNFIFYKRDISDFDGIKKIFQEHKINKICHLAAQAGVRYSLTHPFVYAKTNFLGFLNLLELSKEFNIEYFLYASSSSVYGKNDNIPFSESDRVDKPISLYAATKRSDELLAFTYNHLFNIKTVGLRFFTVYGPWGRPDMAIFKFIKAILADETIDVYNQGDMLRDFTYIDDIVDGIISALKNSFDCEIFNLGNNNPVKLMYLIEVIEKTIGKKANISMKPLQPGDVVKTYANIDKSIKNLGFEPKTNIEEGIKNFVEWYKWYYGS